MTATIRMEGHTVSRTPTTIDRRRPRAPGGIYALLSIALVILVGAIALTSRQTPPPTISEFAPQAVEQITDASGASDTGSRQGDAEAATPEGAGRASITPPQAIDVARVRQCVGDPPRQIEDPQSPPCVPYWSGDNGGATHRGVTRDEIRFVIEGEYDPSVHEPLVAFFNKRFEFYGRRIRLMTRPAPGAAAEARAIARAVYEEDRAFGSTLCCLYPFDYSDELARLGVVGVTKYPFFPETYLAARRPHVWAYPMGNDRIFSTAGNWYCARFAGRDAVHAGDPLLKMTRRKPGIVLTRASQGADGTSPDPMIDQLAACGERAETWVGELSFEPVSAENAVLQMKTAGVTTVACLCYHFNLTFMMQAATNQAYFPEWLVTTFHVADDSDLIRVFTPQNEQRNALMGLTMQPRELPLADRPSTWAMLEGASTQCTAALKTGCNWNYREMLLLASGIQMAGPRLTPATFEQGLHRSKFPNPPHRIMAGSVGFGDRDHTMTDDAAEMWWSNTAPAATGEGAGAYCYVDQGVRRRTGEFPRDDPFFDVPCHSGAT